MNRRIRLPLSGVVLLAALLAAPALLRAEIRPDPGRLFYTPAQRAQLEQARARNPAGRAVDMKDADRGAPLRYDGVLIRSDGRTTHWIDGRPAATPGSAAGLKPGQVRSEGRIYEPYQILRPTPTSPIPAPPPAPASAP